MNQFRYFSGPLSSVINDLNEWLSAEKDSVDVISWELLSDSDSRTRIVIVVLYTTVERAASVGFDINPNLL
jgi:hypothetical protein